MEAGEMITVGAGALSRVIKQYWVSGTVNTDTVVDGYSYDYDRDGNVTSKNNVGYANANPGSTAFNENYTYDNLSQLVNVSRGTNSNFAKYQVDALGNISNTFEVSTDDSNTFNSENQMTAFAGTSLAYDNNGNLTTDQNGDTLVYDAWNRLVAVYNSTGLLIKAYQYDGLGRLITETDGTNTTDLYYSSNWQVIEERTGVTYPYMLSTGSNGTVSAEYVYSPVYVNAPIVWNKDTDGDGTLDTQFFYTSDANYDVTSVISGGSVQERVVYDAYGNASFYSSSWSPLGGDSLNIRPLWQGGWFDQAIGSYEFENRWYNPALMRWMTEDPIGVQYIDGPNLYALDQGNPINGLDPSGEAMVSSFWVTQDPRIVKRSGTDKTIEWPFSAHARFKCGDVSELEYRQYVKGYISKNLVSQPFTDSPDVNPNTYVEDHNLSLYYGHRSQAFNIQDGYRDSDGKEDQKNGSYYDMSDEPSQNVHFKYFAVRFYGAYIRINLYFIMCIINTKTGTTVQSKTMHIDDYVHLLW